MSRKTICQVIDYGGLTGGSFIPAMQSLAEAIVARGDRFVLLGRRFPNATWPHEVAGAGIDLRLFERDEEVFGELRGLGADVVHTHFARYDIGALRVASGAKVYWHAHSYRFDRSVRARAKAFVRYRVLGARVEAIVAVSAAVGNECIDFYAPRKRVRVIHNGIDTDRFRPGTSEERATARNKYGIAAADRVVLFFERLPSKGGDTLKRALQQLSGVRLLVVGGTKEDRDRFGTSPDVISIARVADARELYWAADALAFPSEREGFGFVVAEALACSLPIAASDIPVVREICEDVSSVALFPVGDPQALAASLGTALTPTTDVTGRQRAVSKFSLREWTSRMLQLYDK